jgi:hypothetical protein
MGVERQDRIRFWGAVDPSVGVHCVRVAANTEGETDDKTEAYNAIHARPCMGDREHTLLQSIKYLPRESVLWIKLVNISFSSLAGGV